MWTVTDEFNGIKRIFNSSIEALSYVHKIYDDNHFSANYEYYDGVYHITYTYPTRVVNLKISKGAERS